VIGTRESYRTLTAGPPSWPLMTDAFNRRQALARLGTVSLGTLLAACGDGGGSGDSATVTTTEGSTATVEPRRATSAGLAARFDDAASCAVTAELTEGPYYFDAGAIRRDIREDREGVRLRLGLRVRDAASCEPLPSAVADLWHCDAGGLYSGFESASTGGPGGGRSDDERYLRGAQVTDAEGIAEFVTIYPGWYSGRTPHIHAKVHLDRETVLTTQLYFDERTSAAVYAREPYAERGAQDRSNASDGIFDPSLVLTLSEDEDGYLGLMTFDVRRA
jgi:protocatechuate 3,4-dioxygenase beta subunit